MVATFDVDERKAGKLLHDAEAVDPNKTMQLANVSPSSVTVQRGPTLDSIIPQLWNYFIHESNE